jgi:hypothetical protein
MLKFVHFLHITRVVTVLQLGTKGLKCGLERNKVLNQDLLENLLLKANVRHLEKTSYGSRNQAFWEGRRDIDGGGGRFYTELGVVPSPSRTFVNPKSIWMRAAESLWIGT